MYKKIIYFCLILSLFLVGCSEENNLIEDSFETNQEELETTTTIETTTTTQMSTTTTMEFVEETGLFSDKISFEDEGMSGEIIKDRITKKAEIKLEMSFTDEEEFIDEMGEIITSVPMTVNMLCGGLARAYFLTEHEEDEIFQLEQDSDMAKLLEGYEVNRFEMLFRNRDSNENIARCESSSAEWEEIKFTTYRDYSNVNSFFGAVIGEKMEEE